MRQYVTAAEDVRMTRGRLLALGGTALVGLAGLRVSPAEARPLDLAAQGYVSRPDLKPPAITVVVPATRAESGLVFLAPFDISAASGNPPSVPASESRSGPLVVDDQGEPVWFLPLGSKTAMDFRVQKYRGRRVLTWYEGTVLGAYGGSYVVFDPTYHQIATVRAGRGRHGDLHEFLLTPKGTALIAIYNDVVADLTSVGGPREGRLVTGVVQEIDVATKRVLFEWRSNEHVGVAESFMTEVTPAGNVDYFHLNSVAVDRDGHLLISARHTSTVYKVDRKTGKVIWRLGGKQSDFTFGPGASFDFQHDVRRRADGTLTIFDNGGALPDTGTSSRGIRIALDMPSKRATLVREYLPPGRRDGWAMGNVQQLADGGVFVGWGTDGSYSEFDAKGRLRYDARFADASVSYRAFRWTWAARPTGRPASAVVRNDDGTMTVFASWNGATEVARWRVETGASQGFLSRATTHERTGFETAITLPATSGYVSVVALDSTGKPLGTALPVAV
jgi:hypothetical protein